MTEVESEVVVDGALVRQQVAEGWAQRILDQEFNGRTFDIEQMAQMVLGSVFVLSALAQVSHLEEEKVVQLVRDNMAKVRLLRGKPANA